MKHKIELFTTCSFCEKNFNLLTSTVTQNKKVKKSAFKVSFLSVYLLNLFGCLKSNDKFFQNSKKILIYLHNEKIPR